ncbi:MAG: DUF2493 domain-containing protein [Clostridia bacterium]|nr:DUF2493 domain-containing protein [Clostridia bacterium]
MFKKELTTKRVVIAGCRDYNNYEQAKLYIDYCLSNIRKENNIVIVSGCASGADTIGERYAEENGFKVEKYPADWKAYGRSAGPKRNKQMAEVSDYVICFWDEKSKGTKSMIDYAIKCNKPVKIKKIFQYS